MIVIILFPVPIFATEDSASRIPALVRGLCYTEADILRIRELVKTDEVLKIFVREVMEKSEPWIQMSLEQIDQKFPPVDAVYAYGYDGDPKTDGKWESMGGHGICSMDRPFEVKSPYTNDVYGIQKPGEPYYDDGKGWKREKDGKVFYFKGIWNAYIIGQIHSAIDDLGMAYMLTGKEIYADRALYMLDRIATIRSHRSKEDGIIDFPIPRGLENGFMTYMGGQANRRMISSAMAFDLIGKAPMASKSSPSNPALTVFENIRTNYFSLFEKGETEGRHSLQGHAGACYANMLALGVLFGYPDYIRTAIEVPYGLLDNAIDREGESFEAGALYDKGGRENVSMLTCLLGNYKPANYPNPDEFPDPSKYRGNLQFGNMEEWYKASILTLYSISTISRLSQYGDCLSDYAEVNPDRYTPENTATTLKYNLGKSVLSLQRLQYLKVFYHQTKNEEWKKICQRLYWAIPDSGRSNFYSIKEGIAHYGASMWLDIPKPKDENDDLPLDLAEKESIIRGQKRIIVLRSGDGKNQRAVFVHGGSANAHSHNDQMAIILYSDEMSLTGIFGYGLWGTPAHRGWGTRSIAQKMVVVDEDLPAAPLFASYPPVRIDGYIPSGPAQVIEMSNPKQWPHANLSEYRRQTWMIDISENAGYFIDIFWILGGRTHDYVWNVPFVNPPRNDAFHIEGVTPMPVKGVWSLAALSGKNRDAIFNQPGKSWGERLDATSQTIRNIGIPGEKLTSYNWNPDPGNGYGFIWNVKAAETNQNWSATWMLHDQKHFEKIDVLNSSDQTVISGKAPSLKTNCPHDIVIARNKAKEGVPLQSRYVTVAQVSENGQSWPVKSVKSIEGLHAKDVGIVLTLNSGEQDILLAAGPGNNQITVPGIKFVGRRVFIRRSPEGSITNIVLNEGTLLETNGITISLPQSNWSGEVQKVSEKEIVVNAFLPPGRQLAHQAILFSSNPKAGVPYSSNEVFLVDTIEPVEGGKSAFKFNLQSTIAARLKIQEKDNSGIIETYWPNELAAVMEEKNPSRVFEGHLLKAEEDASKSSIITAYVTKKTLRVENPEKIEPNKYYDLMAVQPGDQMRIPTLAKLKLVKEGQWKLNANIDVDLKFPLDSSELILESQNHSKSSIKVNKQGFFHIPLSTMEKGVVTLTQIIKK